jgi:hypothetical protein
MDRPNENTTEANWLNTHVDTERANLVRQLFPFRTPPLDVARNCLIIDDPNIQLQTAFHDTSSSIFLSPRKDRKILVPAIAFENQPVLNLWVIVSDTLPKTHEVTNRRWATWCGRNILQSIPTDLLSFTPESGVKVLEQSRRAKEIYRQLLAGKDQDREGLRQIMQNLGIAGDWLKYYTEEIPQKALNEPIKNSESINQIFSGLEEKIENAEAKFRELSPEDRGLLNNPFRITIKSRFQKPYAYFSEKVDAIRKNTQNTLADEPFVRDPLEIVGRTQGVGFDEVETIFLPDDLDTSEVKIVKGRISEMGLGDRVKSASEISGVEKYATCDLRYKRFTPNLLAQYIEEGRFKPLVPAEWKESKVYKGN